MIILLKHVSTISNMEKEIIEFLTTTTIEYWAGFLTDKQIKDIEKLMKKGKFNWHSYLHQDLKDESEEVIRRICRQIICQYDLSI